MAPVAYRASRDFAQVEYIERETSLPKGIVIGIRGWRANCLNKARRIIIYSECALIKSSANRKIVIMVPSTQLASHIFSVLGGIGDIVSDVRIVRPDDDFGVAASFVIVNPGHIFGHEAIALVIVCEALGL